MSAKQIVKAFYASDWANDDSIVSEFFHKDCELHWTSTQGFSLLNFKAIEAFFQGTRESYSNLRFVFTHLIESGAFITTRHTAFGTTIENQNSETILAHFTTIWEVREGKLYRGFEISQQADESDEKSMKSYKEINI